ncbi:SusC/RagA family TonB-linked outer membrane protein [Dysgonomonas sp. GY75]|uniref:SusC/RagA family TonB-linked outer membrane protein n=1 Tax=Dysgonomonas sp. GY75 TaxID=2780419 RepID=UPI0018831DE3|nr:SusC/RagA family TonB-linked outer membrane protein [Dysgonomonas sp. GY75]MBF0648216.1 SusC/RagA family TonB-linked outer membrane protein [Dysgonomonas sp. GY75]
MKKTHKYSLFVLLFIFIPLNIFSQEVIVKGTILDKKDNEPLISVAVAALDKSGKISSKYSTLSDINGKFTLKVPVASKLKITYLGYDPVIRDIPKENSDMTIYMNMTENMLNEVVVSGFIKKTRADATAAVQVVKTEDLVQTPVANALELLQGRVPGLNVQINNGTPGGVPSFTMRGISDISLTQQGEDFILGSSAPLFVVDGIPQEDINTNTDIDAAGLLAGATVSPLSMIPFEDIESMEILKDAAATSLYGSKGAYGVILIETKRGQGKPKVSYSGNYVVKTPPNLRDVIVGNAERSLRIAQILQNDTSYYHGHNEIHKFPALADSLNPYWNNNTNWQGRFYGVTHNQTHNLSFSGGDRKFDYKINGNYYTEKGIIKNTDFNRYGLRTRLGYRPNDKFEMDVNISATFTLNSQGSGNAFSQAGVAKGTSASSLLPPPSMYTASNEALAAFSVDDNNVNNSYDANMNVKYRLPYEIGFNGTFAYKYNTAERETFTPGILNNNRSKWSNTSGNSYSLYSQLLFSRTNNISIFRIGLTAGIEISSKKEISNNVTLVGSGSDYILAPGAMHGTDLSGGSASFKENENTFSFILNPTFGFGSMGVRGERYIFIPNIRPEANSNYGAKVKWTVSPSISFRWNFSREPFADTWKKMDAGALRVSWGRTTKYTANRYDIWGTYKLTEDSYNGMPVIPIDYGLLPNDNIKPVTSTSWNLGAETAFFRNKLRFTGDVYYRQTDNQLSDVNLADHNAFTKVRSIETSIVNYGIELLIGGKPLSEQSPWVLDLALSIAVNRDIIAKLPNEARQIIHDKATIVNRLGSNALANYLLVNKGVYATDEDVPVNPATGERMKAQNNNKNGYVYMQAGDPIWVDVNGDYIIDDKDKVVVGNSQPRVTGGFNLNLRYKAFSVNTNFSFVIKRDIINKALADRFSAYSDPLSQSLHEKGALAPIEAYDFWGEGNRDAKYPNPFDYIRGGTRDHQVNFFRPDQTLFMEDGSYLKINGISVAYTFPKNVLEYLKVSRLQLNASVNNIYTFSKYSGVNPENVNGLGYDVSGGYPNSRSWTVGLSMDF